MMAATAHLKRAGNNGWGFNGLQQKISSARQFRHEPVSQTGEVGVKHEPIILAGEGMKVYEFSDIYNTI